MKRPKLLLTAMLASLLSGCEGQQSSDNTEGLEWHSFPGEFGSELGEWLPLPGALDVTQQWQDYRQHNMRQMSAAYRGLELVLRHNAVQFSHHLESQATVLALAAERVNDSFAHPAPATTGEPGARPDIWSDASRFEQHVRGLERESAALSRMVQADAANSEQLLQQLNRVRHQCLSCHDTFRVR